MAIDLSKKALALSKGIKQEPEIILRIAGVSTLYSINKAMKAIRIGDPGLLIGNSWVIGGANPIDDQENLISFDGTSTTITQQLLQDRGGVSSVSAIQIALLNKDDKISKLISPGIIVPDILGRKAEVFLGYKNTRFPEDFFPLFSGIIDETDGAGIVRLNIAHPEAGKRYDIFQKATTDLSAAAEYRSGIIQSIKYQTRRDVVGTVSIAYTTGATAGAEVVTVVGNAISVQIQSGTSTASQVRNAIEKKIEALSLVSLAILSNQTATPQVAQGATNLGTDSTIHVASTKGFLLPGDSGTVRTYIRIDDEIIEYTGITDTTFTGCTRAAMESEDARAFATRHDEETEVSSWYRLQGNAFDLALKVMLSGPDDYFVTDVKVNSFVEVPGIGEVPNALYFEGVDVSTIYSIVIGDFVTTQDDANADNNFTMRQVADVVVFDGNSYIIVDGDPLVLSAPSDATVSFRSKYNVLPDGCGLGLGADQVDVPEFERLKTLYFASIFTYDFYLDDTEKGKDFIDTDILFPTGAYSIPRKGKISVGYTSPPLATSTLPVLDATNTMKPQSNSMKRSLNKNFYNVVTYKYNANVLETDRFLSGDVEVSGDSRAQIDGVGLKSFTIEARGLRATPDNIATMNIIKARILERYRFAAETTQVQTFYGAGFTTDVGDPVLYGDPSLKLIDTRTGKTGFTKRIFEVVNKSMNILTGAISLSLVDTNYLSDGRYGVFGPSSFVGVGSGTDFIKIVNSYATVSPQTEKPKWVPYIGEKILVHDEDWTFSEETTLIGFDPADNYKMLIDPPLSQPPEENWVIDMPNYPGASKDDGAPYKNTNCFFNPSIPVTGGSDSSSFEVDLADAGKFFEGSVIILRLEDWSSVSAELKVIDVTGNVVTIDGDFGYIPDTTRIVELVGFVDDEGPAYRYI